MTRRRHPFLLAAAAVLAGSALAGCSGQDLLAPRSASAGPTTGTGPVAAADGSVTVLAASSLTKALTAIAADYQKAHPDAVLHLSFGSSTTLVEQVDAGAQADVLVVAGAKAYTGLRADTRAILTPVTLATNYLEIAVPKDNPAKVTSIADLGKSNVKVVACVRTAPCGSAADVVFAHSGVHPNFVSREVDAKATLTKVTLGEVDAGVVYHSDVVGAKDSVIGIPLTGAATYSLSYPMVVLTTNPVAKDFGAYLAGPQARAVLLAAGFGPPQ